MNISIKTFSYDARVRTFVAMSAACLLCFGLYIYGIQATVRHTAERQSLQSELTTLTTAVSQLQFKDIALRNHLDLASAYTMGFKDITHPLYISGSHALSFNTLPR